MSRTKPAVCLVSCYYDNNYIRTVTLKQALAQSPYELVYVGNKQRGLWRYAEVTIELIKTRLSKRPDIYFLAFRGYEMLPVVRLITIGKPLIIDEFINPLELVVHEQKLVKNRLLAAVLRWGYRLWLRSVQAITTDTASHAKYSAELMKLPLSSYTVLPMSSNEVIFDAGKYQRVGPRDDKFEVFYYGTMLPLHGVDTILGAMELFKDRPDIELTMVGGKAKARQQIEAAQRAGARINYIEWIDFDKFPMAMKRANVCLGGPFGDTVQSQFVITGKTLQQMSLGCPVIIGANHESAMFTDKQNALIVDQGDPKKLAEAIVWAYDNRDRLAEIGRNGRELYRDRFSTDKLAGKVGDLLAKFVKDR